MCFPFISVPLRLGAASGEVSSSRGRQAEALRPGHRRGSGVNESVAGLQHPQGKLGKHHQRTYTCRICCINPEHRMTYDRDSQNNFRPRRRENGKTLSTYGLEEKVVMIPNRDSRVDYYQRKACTKTWRRHK